MTERQIAPERYTKGGYQSLARFISYSYQLDLIRASGARSVLIVGVGDGVVPTLLKKDPHLTVTTCDIDAELAPDLVGDICALPCADGAFDAVCAFEVLEHMPWEESRKAIAELARVSKGAVLISVPHRRTGIELAIRFPFMRSLLRRDVVRVAFLVPIRFPKGVSKQHYWEIDGRTTTLRMFRGLLSPLFKRRREVTAVLDPYRRFFVLGKQ
ncbi:MAG: class I SAM-dependent methyltransferase [Candidatus Paceibacterota bacterium]